MWNFMWRSGDPYRQYEAAVLVVASSNNEISWTLLGQNIQRRLSWKTRVEPRRFSQFQFFNIIINLVSVCVKAVCAFKWREKELFGTAISTARLSNDVPLEIELYSVSVAVIARIQHDRGQWLSAGIAKFIINVVNARIYVVIKVVFPRWRIWRWTVWDFLRRKASGR